MAAQNSRHRSGAIRPARRNWRSTGTSWTLSTFATEPSRTPFGRTHPTSV
jgi:hypothetical protein